MLSTQKHSTGLIGLPVTKTCSDCGLDLPLTSYHKSRHYCKQCKYKSDRERRKINPWGYATANAKYRAKKKGLEFNITPEYIKSIDTDTCPYLNIPIFWNVSTSTDGRAVDNSKSIDRIDSSKGYVKGNVIVCSWRANSILSNATAAEMALITVNFHRILNERPTTFD